MQASSMVLLRSSDDLRSFACRRVIATRLGVPRVEGRVDVAVDMMDRVGDGARPMVCEFPKMDDCDVAKGPLFRAA